MTLISQITVSTNSFSFASVRDTLRRLLRPRWARICVARLSATQSFQCSLFAGTRGMIDRRSWNKWMNKYNEENKSGNTARIIYLIDVHRLDEMRSIYANWRLAQVKLHRFNGYLAEARSWSDDQMKTWVPDRFPFLPNDWRESVHCVDLRDLQITWNFRKHCWK